MVELDSNVLNTVEEIKELLMLETENQTLTDDQFTTYLNTAHKQMISDIRRSVETDCFTSDATGTVIFTPYFNVHEIKGINVNDVAITSDKYELVYDNDGVSIEDIKEGDEVEIIYIPENYKMLEQAICVVNILTRLQPFTNDTVNPVYADWREKRKDFTKVIRSKFGVANYSG